MSTAQPQVEVQFVEIDFQAIEGQGSIDITLTVTGNTVIPLELIVTPYTFEEYQMEFDVTLMGEILERSQGVDKAECELMLTMSNKVI